MYVNTRAYNAVSMYTRVDISKMHGGASSMNALRYTGGPLKNVIPRITKISNKKYFTIRAITKQTSGRKKNKTKKGINKRQI